MQVVISYCGKLGTETEQKVNTFLHYMWLSWPLGQTLNFTVGPGMGSN